MATPPVRSNGWRRTDVTRRVTAEETHCAVCGGVVDKTLSSVAGRHGPKCRGGECAGCVPHPMRAEVDEDIPRSRGGSHLDRNNCHLVHRQCNQLKGNMTLAEYRNSVNEVAELQISNLVKW